MFVVIFFDVGLEGEKLFEAKGLKNIDFSPWTEISTQWSTQIINEMKTVEIFLVIYGHEKNKLRAIIIIMSAVEK